MNMLFWSQILMVECKLQDAAIGIIESIHITRQVRHS